MTDTPNTTARMYAGYYRELRASGVPRGLAETMVATAAAAKDWFLDVHPDALAAVDATRDKALNGKKAARAESASRHSAGKQDPEQTFTRWIVEPRYYPKAMFDEPPEPKPGPKVRKTLGGGPRSGPVDVLHVYGDSSHIIRRAETHVDFLRDCW